MATSLTTTQILGPDDGVSAPDHARVILKPGAAEAGSTVKHRRGNAGLVEDVDVTVDDSHAASGDVVVRRAEVHGGHGLLLSDRAQFRQRVAEIPEHTARQCG